jgi:hypothetical protein
MTLKQKLFTSSFIIQFRKCYHPLSVIIKHNEDKDEQNNTSALLFNLETVIIRLFSNIMKIRMNKTILLPVFFVSVRNVAC